MDIEVINANNEEGYEAGSFEYGDVVKCVGGHNSQFAKHNSYFLVIYSGVGPHGKGVVSLTDSKNIWDNPPFLFKKVKSAKIIIED